MKPGIHISKIVFINDAEQDYNEFGIIPTPLTTLSLWLEQAKEKGATHLIFNEGGYPVKIEAVIPPDEEYNLHERNFYIKQRVDAAYNNYLKLKEQYETKT